MTADHFSDDRSGSELRRVLVIGAGIAGPTVAYWLARHGVEVDIVERATDRPSRGYVVNAFGHCLDIVRAMELGDAVDETRLRVDHTVGLGPDGRQIYRRDLRSVTDGSRGIAVYRSDLANLVESAAVGLDGVRLERNRSVSELQVDDDGVTASFTDGRPDATYDLVIAADGVHSATRTRYVTADAEHILPARFLGATIADPVGLEPNTRFEYCGIGANLVMVPSGTGDATIVVFARHDPAASAEPHDTAAELARLGSGWPEPVRTVVASITADDTVFADALVQVQAPRWSTGRLVLLGDAAACMSPLSGRGVDAAITGGFVLAEQLTTHPGGIRAAVDAYEHQLRPEIERLQTAAERRVGMAAPRSRAQVAALRASLKYTPERLFQRMVERQFTNPLVPSLDHERIHRRR